MGNSIYAPCYFYVVTINLTSVISNSEGKSNLLAIENVRKEGSRDSGCHLWLECQDGYEDQNFRTHRILERAMYDSRFAYFHQSQFDLLLEDSTRKLIHVLL